MKDARKYQDMCRNTQKKDCWRQLIRKREMLSPNFRINRFRKGCFAFESNYRWFNSDSDRSHLTNWRFVQIVVRNENMS